MTKAIVYYGEKKAGILSETETGYEFHYDPSYRSAPEALPISLSLPLQEEKYHSSRLFPFFEGLLPEGWLLDVTSASLKIDPHDKFQLLLHTGNDPVGAVSIKPLEEDRHV